MLKIIQRLQEKAKKIHDVSPITIAFLGDSVTQGCFECYLTTDGGLETVYDYKNAYSTRLKEILNMLYPNVQINIINSGISGDSATRGALRVERDILAYNPDLVVVSYGLNDSTQGVDGIEQYKKSLDSIFGDLQSKGIDTIFINCNINKIIIIQSNI